MHRLRKVAIGILLVSTACAHKQISATQKEDSLALPLDPPPAIVDIDTKKTARQTVVTVKPRKINIPTPKKYEANADKALIFDIPVAYNSKVKYWIEYFQTSGRTWYVKWLERSSRYLPTLKRTLKRHGLPQDLAYMAMIESGFAAHATSSAQAVGPWQFIKETGVRYGLKVSWWIDERRDFEKSTDAAAKYLRTMYKMFKNWNLVAAGYNTGENRIKRIIKKHGTKSFWKLAQSRSLEDETKDYVPKLMAALLISKAPQIYGFNDINYHEPFSFESYRVPGGTHLEKLAEGIKVSGKSLRELNPDLLHGFVPDHVRLHRIRIPKGTSQLVSFYLKKSLLSER